MPEVVEVATIIDGIRAVEGGVVRTASISQKAAEGKRYCVDKNLLLSLCGKKLQRITQRGKFIVFALKHEQERAYIVAHLGMTGRFTLQRPKKHCHFELQFWDDRALYFEDPRRFGFVKIYQSLTEMQESLNHIGKSVPRLLQDYGVQYPKEVYQQEELRYAAQDFLHSIRENYKGKWNMKKVLMEQKAISGYGNIYAAEALFAAGIHPKQELQSVSDAQLIRLFNESSLIFALAYIGKGSSVDSYRDAEGNKGEAQKLHKVYNREGLPCYSCETPIEKIKQQGRSTFFCPKCQTIN